MKKLTVIIPLILLTVAAYAAAVNGWDKATWGMSKEKIKTLYAESAIQDGNENTLVIPSMEFEGNKYLVTFYFTAEKLSKVSLSMDVPDRTVYNTMVDKFTRQYGKPAKKTDNDYIGYTIWAFQKTKSTLSCAYSKGLGGSPTLQLNFEQVQK